MFKRTYKRLNRFSFQVAPGHGDSPGMNDYKCQYCFTVITDHNHLLEHLRQHELRGVYCIRRILRYEKQKSFILVSYYESSY